MESKRKSIIKAEYKALLSIFSLILIMSSQLLAGGNANSNIIYALLAVGYVSFVASLFFLIKPLLTFKK